METEMDLGSIITSIGIEFWGAFLGVLSALLLDKYNSNRQYKNLNHKLYSELQGIRGDLLKRNLSGEGDAESSDDSFHYLTPIWDISLAAGQLSLLSNKHIDDSYLTIYSKIQYAQYLESEYIHSRLIDYTGRNDFLECYVNSLDEERRKLAVEIIKEIDRLNQFK